MMVSKAQGFSTFFGTIFSQGHRLITFETTSRFSLEKLPHQLAVLYSSFPSNTMVDSRETSLITLITSEHGKMRREQRDISKRDLQKALKHGSREPNYKARWKIEYDGIIFITDNSMRHEITMLHWTC